MGALVGIGVIPKYLLLPDPKNPKQIERVDAEGLAFNEDGTKLYVPGFGHYELGIPWDWSTSVYVQEN